MHPCDANRMAYGQIPLYPAFILANENGRKSREDRVTLVCNYSPTLGRTDAWPSCYSVSPFVYRTNTPHRHYLPHLSSSSSFLHHLRLVRIRKKRREEKKISSIHGRVVTIEIISVYKPSVQTRRTFFSFTPHPHTARPSVPNIGGSILFLPSVASYWRRVRRNCWTAGQEKVERNR